LLRLSLTTLPCGRQSKKSSQASVSPAPSVNGTLSWLALVDALDCSFAKNALACVPSKPAAQIKSIEEHLILAFDPAFDDVTTLSDLQQAKAEHRIASIPVLTGTNSSEGRLLEVGQKDITAATFPESTELHQAVAAAYSLGYNGLNTAYDVNSQIFTEYWYQCPSAIEVGAFPRLGTPHGAVTLTKHPNLFLRRRVSFF